MHNLKIKKYNIKIISPEHLLSTYTFIQKFGLHLLNFLIICKKKFHVSMNIR